MNITFNLANNRLYRVAQKDCHFVITMYVITFIVNPPLGLCHVNFFYFSHHYDVYSCVCDAGYNGALCQYSTCSGVTCQNGGKAVPQAGGACVCCEYYINLIKEKDLYLFARSIKHICSFCILISARTKIL